MSGLTPKHDRRQWLVASSIGAVGAMIGGSTGTHAQSAKPLFSPAGDPDWKAVAAQYAVDEGLTYFNAGTCGLSLKTVVEAECRNRDAISRDFIKFFVEHYFGEPPVRLVERIASFVGAPADDVAIVSGSTEAMNIVASGLDLAEGDEVLTTTHEHQAGIYPWLLAAKRRRCTVRQVPLPSPAKSAAEILERISSAIGPKTRVLSICHVNYTDGVILPVKQLCALARQRGIVSVVDGAQAVGMIDLRIADIGCDVYATSLHKWLGSPYGTGLLAIRRDVQDRIWPSVVEGFDGWDTVDRYGNKPSGPGRDFVGKWPAAMQKYAWGVAYFGPLIWAALGAVEFHEKIGPARIEARTRELTTRLRRGLADIPGATLLTPEDPTLWAGMTSFKLQGIATRPLNTALNREHRMVIRTVTHGAIGFDANRVCTHIFNTEEQVDRLLGVLTDRARRGSTT
ncbi:MAG: aminotransferase class V-fold PLP-dependent enzyme [Acidobacteriota bacterium]